tara:strand:- start:2465 stop:5812 length:3348 start_codon:yes stop_codon:yes gene_type:complete
MLKHPYVELHCHSGFSFLDGSSHPQELILEALKMGYPAIALTDHNGLYGSMEFAQEAHKNGIHAITGSEITIALDICNVSKKLGSLTRPDGENDILSKDCHLTILAENMVGYSNLCKLISEAHLKKHSSHPHVLLSSLLTQTEGLIILTGCRKGPLSIALEDSFNTAEILVRKLKGSLNPDQLFIEIQDNERKGDRYRNRSLGCLADRFNIPLVATRNVHYHDPSRSRIQDVLVSIRNRTTLDGSHKWRRPNAQFYLASPEEMFHRFQNRPDALKQTLKIAEKCAHFDLTQNLGYTFPDFQKNSQKKALDSLKFKCLSQLENYYEGSPLASEARERLYQELALVDIHNLAGFFLVYSEIIELAEEVSLKLRTGVPRNQSGLPPGRGRGSSVSSIICYLIGLSHIDPVKSNLFLGRFLNKDMQTMPDIDLDFPRDIREELILQIYKKYGYDHAALVCTFSTYRARSAIREVGKVLGIPIEILTKISKSVERHPEKCLSEILRPLPGFSLKTTSPLWKTFHQLVKNILGLPRHISQHVGGMIISSRPLTEMVPLEPSIQRGRILCQWDKDSCNDAGFIKIDFLSLGMLSLVDEAIDLISNRHPHVPNLSRINFEDQEIYDQICSGETIGTFQLESRAQIQMGRRIQPRDLNDLAIQIAIVRPGPILGGGINMYTRKRELLRNNSDYVIQYEHPILEEILGETLGVIVFQDQVLQICRHLAGFSDGEADSMRRSMSRKRSKQSIESYWEAFQKGCKSKNIDESVARKIFQQILAFSDFGFPKSHAVAFSLLAYQSVWLRHYYSTEYYVALFNNQPMGFYSLDALSRDAQRKGIQILLPNINLSKDKCTPESSDLRIGLGLVKGWGMKTAISVITERQRYGPFRSLSEFLQRMPDSLNRNTIENLILVGGFKDFGLTRRELLWQLGLWMGPRENLKSRTVKKKRIQTELRLEDPNTAITFPELTTTEQIIMEYRMLHFSAGFHPLSLLRKELDSKAIFSDRLCELSDRHPVKVSGIVVARQRPSSAKGYVFISLEDEHGFINVVVNPKLYKKSYSILGTEPFLVVYGHLEKSETTLNVLAYDIERLDVYKTKTPPQETNGAFNYLKGLRRFPPKSKDFS